MAALFFATHPSTPQSQLWNPSFSSPGHQPQSLQITRENAQFILPTDACVHVGNLSRGVCPEILRHELEQLLFQFALNAYTPHSSSYTSSLSSNTLDTQPTTPGCDGVVACEADQEREEEYIKDNRSNLPCDMPLSTGRTVRDYVNEVKRLRGVDLSDETTRELILELEEEARDQGLLPALTSKPD
ncbi:hypothetical protein ABHI18_000286 [Aspergillus niger]